MIYFETKLLTLFTILAVSSGQLCISDYDCAKTLECKRINNTPYNVCTSSIGTGVQPVTNKCTADLECTGTMICLSASVTDKYCQNPTYCTHSSECSSGQSCLVHYNGLHVCQYGVNDFGNAENDACSRDSDCRVGLRCVDYFGMLQCKNLGESYQPTTACLSSAECFNGESCVYRASTSQYVCMWMGEFSTGGDLEHNDATATTKKTAAVGGNVGLVALPVIGGNIDNGPTKAKPTVIGGNVGAPQPQDRSPGKNDKNVHTVGGNIGLISTAMIGGNVVNGPTSTNSGVIGGNIGSQPPQNPSSTYTTHKIGGNTGNGPTNTNTDSWGTGVIGGNIAGGGGQNTQPNNYSPAVGGNIVPFTSSNSRNQIGGNTGRYSSPTIGSNINGGYMASSIDDANQLVPFDASPKFQSVEKMTTSSPDSMDSSTEVQLPTYSEARVVPKSNLIDPAAMPCGYDYQCRMGESCSGIVQLVDRNVTVCQYDVTKKNRMCILHADCIQGQICSKNATGTFVCTDSYEAATGNLKCQYDYECSGGEVCLNVGKDSEKKFRCRQPDYADPRRNQKCSSNVDCPYQQVCREVSGLAICVDIGSTVAKSTGREIQEKVFKFVHDLLFARA